MAGRQGVATPMAQNADHKAALEAARAALLVVHSAAALALPASKSSSRLLRAAEGLVRLAVVGLNERASVVQPASGACAAHEAVQPKGNKDKKAKRKKKKKKAEQEKDVIMHPGGEGSADAAVCLTGALEAAGPGGAVLCGDLSEFGIGDTQLLVRASSSASCGIMVPGAEAAAQHSFAQRAAVSLAAQSPLVLRGWCKEAELPIVGKKRALVARLAGAVSSTSLCGALRALAVELAAPAPPGPGPGDADMVKFFEVQLVDLRAQGFPEGDILVTECIARRDLHRHKLG